jgi:hypothetical protein
MANPFQPLEARLTPTREPAGHAFRLKVLPHSSAAAPAPAPAPPGPQGAPPPADPHEPTITLEREGERITAIHIQCACGRVIELGCVY